jgi:hypothetical protein
LYRIQDLNENDIQTTNFEGEIVDSFDEMGLKPELLRGIFGYGFVNLKQKQSI